jgi:rubrerythrin
MNVLEFAINMENDGERYYREQAELNRDNGLFVVCSMLADDEKNHAALLRSRYENREYVLDQGSEVDRVGNVFSGLGDIGLDEKELIGQLDFYKLAAERERESIVLYSEMLEESVSQENEQGAKDILLFEFLIKQEEEHLSVLEELVKLLGHAEDWVENAEFGNREEY